MVFDDIFQRFKYGFYGSRKEKKMNHKTINDVNASAHMFVDEINNYIDIRYDLSHPCCILTTAPTPLAREFMLYLQGHGEYYCYAGSSTRRSHMHSYMIMLTLSGNEVLEYQNNKYQMSAGTFYWIDCMQPHYFYTLESDQPRHAMWIHFNGFSAEFYYKQFLRLNNNSHTCKLPRDNKIVEGIKELIRLYYDHNESLEVDIAASAIITNIVTACVISPTLGKNQTSVPKTIVACKNFSISNYQENITLGSLAERFSINKYHLQKQFKRYIGISPNDFLIHTRLTHAKELLRTTDYSINQIAQEIGIMEASNFSRLFKKWENMTPLEYRRYWCEPTLTVVDNL